MNRRIQLTSFNGTTQAPPGCRPQENYWALIGHAGEIVGPRNRHARFLVKFDVQVASLGLECHNEVENSLLILESDLRLLA